jgi:hypothetical protein
MRLKLLSLSIVLAGLLCGCTGGGTSGKKTNEKAAENSDDKKGGSPKNAEDEVQKSFTALQKAIKDKDADKVWDLLVKDRQTDADREAKAARETYDKLPEKDRAGFEKKMALTGDQFAKMTGKVYLRSAKFHGKTHEIPDSKVEKITVSGDSGTLKYVEEDGDKISVNVAKETGGWKFDLAIPRAPEN